MANWYKPFWFVIETIVQKNDANSLKTLGMLANYLPCNKCKSHFHDFIERNPVLNKDWVALLKYEISLTQKKSNNGMCCQKRNNLH